jgi:hypothetical protein
MEKVILAILVHKGLMTLEEVMKIDGVMQGESLEQPIGYYIELFEKNA